MKQAMACLLAVALSIAPVSADAGPLVYPQLNVPDRGARLGVTLEGPYTWNGIQVIKIIEVNPRSGLYGIVYPGDYLYGINGFNLRSADDVSAIIRPGTPGSTATVWYLDSRHNYATMKVTVATTSSAAIAQYGGSANAASSNVAASPPPRTKAYCEEHYIICGLGALLVVGAVAAAASGSGSGSDSRGSADRPRSNDDDYRRQQGSAPRNDPPPDPPRTYGLYGNCPQPGAGYGC